MRRIAGLVSLALGSLIAGAQPATAGGYIYDNVSEGWPSSASLPSGRSAMGYSVLGNSLYVVAGDGPVGTTNAVHRYDGGTSWTTCASIPYARRNPGVFALGGYLYCVGGESNGWATINATRYNGSSWTAVGDLPEARRDFASAVLGGQGYVIGGIDGGANNKNTVYKFDGTNWTTATALPANRNTAIAATLGNTLYLMGGTLDAGVQASSILKFDGTNWTSAGTMPRWQYRPAVCVESNAIVIVGGMNTSYSAITNIMAFDGTNWTERSGLAWPLYSEAAGVVSNRLYVVGGGSTPSTDTLYHRDATTGVTPTSGDKTGGFTVTIMGTGLGNGSDITNVTLCGAAVNAINSQKATQVVVTAGAHPTGGSGDVLVYSTSQGMTVKSNYFTYNSSLLGLYYYTSSNDTYYYIASQSAPTSALRTDFGAVQKGQTYTSELVVAEDSYSLAINISTVQVTGAGAAAFGVSGVPASLVAGDYSNFLVRFTPPDIGVYTAAVSFVNDGQLSPYIMYVAGTATGAVASLSVLGTNGAGITSGAAASGANGSLFRPSVLGTAYTNTFSITNNGTAALSISGYVTNGTDRACFAVAGIPATVAVGGASNFTVIYRPTAVGSHTASLVISNNSPTAAYAVNFAGSCFHLSTNAGPSVGGNTITITNGNFGTITNVLVGGVRTTIQASGTNWVRITIPVVGSTGAMDVVIQSSDRGDTTLAGAYTVNPAGAIGYYTNAWEEVSGLPAGRLGLGVAAYSNAIYAAGGYTCESNVYCFNGVTWEERPSLPQARRNMPLCVYNGILYGVAGTDPGLNVINSVFTYNGSSWSSNAPVLPLLRTGLAVTAHDDYLYAAGGYYNTQQQGEAWRFNGSSWGAITNLPGVRDWPVLASFHGQLYCVGGNGFGGISVTNVYRYDGVGWSEVRGLPAPRFGMAAAVFNDRLYVYGGVSNTTVQGATFSFDGTNWQTEASLPAARGRVGGAILGGKMYCVGGGTAAASSGQTNVYRYPAWKSDGVTPSSGMTNGGYEVRIQGVDLGDGGDITNVMLCGVSVQSIVSQSATQVVVVAGSAAIASLGDVRVFSTSFGETVKSNAFSYNPSITVVAGVHGSVTPSGVVEVVYGGTMNFVAAADAYYHVAALSTNGADVAAASGLRTYTCVWVNVTAPGLLSAAFAENVALLGTPEWWLAQYGWTNNFEAAETNDPDADRLLTWQEWIAGTDPTNQWSVLSVTNVFPAASGFVLEWPSVTNRVYGVDRATNLIPSGFTAIATNLPATPPANVYTDQVSDKVFYRINVTKP